MRPAFFVYINNLKMEKRHQELLRKRERTLEKLARVKERLGHPHLDFMSAHDLAEQEYKVCESYLTDIEKQIRELETRPGKKV